VYICVRLRECGACLWDVLCACVLCLCVCMCVRVCEKKEIGGERMRERERNKESE